MLAALRRLLGRSPRDPRESDDPPFPRTIFLVVNDACNLRCRSCDVGTGAPGMFMERMRPADPRRLALADLRRLVDDCRPFRPVYAATSVEPLLFADLPAFLAFARGAGSPTQVTTNGWLLPDRAEELSAAGLDSLWVSLDGPPAVHDALRGRDGSFERAVEGIRRYAAAKRARGAEAAVHVNAVVQPGNETALLPLARSLSGLPLRSLTLSHLNFVTLDMARRHDAAAGGRYPARASCVGGLDPAAVDVEALDRELSRLRAERLPFAVAESPALAGAALAAYYRDHAAPAGRGRCLAPWTVAQVLANGDVTGSTRCLDAVLGNVLESPLPRIWRGERMRALRRFLRERPLLPACARCCASL